MKVSQLINILEKYVCDPDIDVYIHSDDGEFVESVHKHTYYTIDENDSVKITTNIILRGD